MRQYFEMSPHPQDQIDDEEDEVEQKSDQEENANNTNQQQNNGAQQGNEVEEMLEQLAIDDAADEGTGQNRQGSSGSA